MNRMIRNLSLAVLAVTLSRAPEVAASPLADYRLEEAIYAMSEGDYQRGLDLCLVVIQQDPKDVRAHREAGRAAHALGRLQIAINHLERAIELQDGARDPEAHYLLGEAYYASGRKSDAMRQHDLVRQQVARPTTDRMELLWMARIHARRGQFDEADAIYRGLLEREPDSVEILISRIEACTLTKRWADAEKLLKDFIAMHPDHPRSKEMLAWVLEAQNKFDEERKLRDRLVLDTSVGQTPRRLLDHARVLERSGEFSLAIQRYEQALGSLGDPEVQGVNEVEVRAAVSRLRYRLTPEGSAGGGAFNDPSGTVYRLRTGVAVPVVDYATVALMGSYEWAAGGATPGAMPTSDVRVGSVDASVVAGQGPVFGAFTMTGTYFSFEDQQASTRIGASVDGRLGQGKPIQLHTVANLNQPWRETASTMREGGRETGITSMLYALPFGPRVVFDAGVRVRGMELEPIDGMESTGTQRMLIGGVDWVAWAPATAAARGQFLDEDLRWGTGYLADSLTLSYRHYEAFTDDEFGGRLNLAPRDTIDEVSAVARNSRPDGLFGIELRGGAGRDWARDIQLYRVGSSVLFTPFETLRASLAYDYSQESTSGFSGERHAAWASMHVDL